MRLISHLDIHISNLAQVVWQCGGYVLQGYKLANNLLGAETLCVPYEKGNSWIYQENFVLPMLRLGQYLISEIFVIHICTVSLRRTGKCTNPYCDRKSIHLSQGRPNPYIVNETKKVHTFSSSDARPDIDDQQALDKGEVCTTF
jgi:hypothetical protein